MYFFTFLFESSDSEKKPVLCANSGNLIRICSSFFIIIHKNISIKTLQ